MTAILYPSATLFKRRRAPPMIVGRAEPAGACRTHRAALPPMKLFLQRRGVNAMVIRGLSLVDAFYRLKRALPFIAISDHNRRVLCCALIRKCACLYCLEVANNRPVHRITGGRFPIDGAFSLDRCAPGITAPLARMATLRLWYLSALRIDRRDFVRRTAYFGLHFCFLYPFRTVDCACSTFRRKSSRLQYGRPHNQHAALSATHCRASPLCRPPSIQVIGCADSGDKHHRIAPLYCEV